MENMLGQLRDMQKKLEETRKQLAEETIEASSGRGAVRVVMSGTQECRQVRDRAGSAREEEHRAPAGADSPCGEPGDQGLTTIGGAQAGADRRAAGRASGEGRDPAARRRIPRRAAG